MKSEDLRGLDPRVEEALRELKDVVQRRYPAASFEVARGQDEPEEALANVREAISAYLESLQKHCQVL